MKGELRVIMPTEKFLSFVKRNFSSNGYRVVDLDGMAVIEIYDYSLGSFGEMLGLGMSFRSADDTFAHDRYVCSSCAK